MEFNFTFSPPHPVSLDESHRIICQLWHRCRMLTEELTELQEKNNLNSCNSSLPPSNDSIAQKAEKRKERDAWKKRTSAHWKKARQGAQAGHEGHGRSLLPLDKIDETIPCYPDKTCSSCQGEINIRKVCERKQVFDLPCGNLHITEYQVHQGRCIECKKKCRGEFPKGTPRGILGSNALAKIASLTGKYRLSKREVKEFLFDFFGLRISVGTISNAETKVSQSLNLPVKEVHAAILKENHLHVDETSHYNKSYLEWLWVATNSKLTYFKIYQHRNQESAKALIGKDYAGIVVTDRYGAYNWLPNSQRQYCWAHLKRDFNKIAERLNYEESFIGQGLSSSLKTIFYFWRLIEKEPKTGPRHFCFMRKAIAKLYRYLRSGCKLKGTKTKRFCEKLLDERKSLWHFLYFKVVDATNNQAERQLRHAVIWRKKSYGTQSVRGVRYVERILTVVMTCRQQKKNIVEWLNQCIQANWHEGVYPSLTD